jgi:hypothetical protein
MTKVLPDPGRSLAWLNSVPKCGMHLVHGIMLIFAPSEVYP